MPKACGLSTQSCRQQYPSDPNCPKKFRRTASSAPSTDNLPVMCEPTIRWKWLCVSSHIKSISGCKLQLFDKPWLCSPTESLTPKRRVMLHCVGSRPYMRRTHVGLDVLFDSTRVSGLFRVSVPWKKHLQQYHLLQSQKGCENQCCLCGDRLNLKCDGWLHRYCLPTSQTSQPATKKLLA